MKAIQYTAFGNSSVLKLNEVSKPSIGEEEVLVRLAATTVNPFDMKVRSGAMQKMLNVQVPYTPGSDIAGVVEAIGDKVTRIKIGDEVFGTVFGGTYAEYIAIRESQITVKPANVSLKEAVSLAVPLVTSYSVLIETAQLQGGHRILIHGASGSVGSVMVQMAKALGAYVIGTASGEGVDIVKSAGADEVIDYKKNDFTSIVKDIDLVADTVGGDAQTKSFSVLKKGGKLISIVMPPSAELAKKYDVVAQFVNSTPSYKKLDFGKQLVEQGKIKPHIAKIFKLEQAAEAQDAVSAGGLNGKVVLELN
jgi:NADPH:quinone reductase-like Zn-dependent oxidoreductase